VVAARGCMVSMEWLASYSTGGTWPVSPWRRRWLYQSTHWAVANSIRESDFQGRRGLIGSFGGRIRERGDHLLAADGAGDTELAHEALDGTAGHDMPLPVQLAPDLPGPVDAVVGRAGLLDPFFELGIAHGAGGGSFEAFRVSGVRGRGDPAVVLGERPADRLDSAEAVPVFKRVTGRSCHDSISSCIESPFDPGRFNNPPAALRDLFAGRPWTLPGMN
jgi:hypothetical protein